MLDKIQVPMPTNRPRTQSQAAPLKRRKPAPSLRMLPGSVTRNALSVAEQSVSGVRRNFLRYFDFHPAFALLTVVGILALVGAIYLQQVTAATNANYTLQALQDEHTQLIRQQQVLKVDIGRAQSLAHIQDVATKNLNMVPIGSNFTYITLAPGPLSAITPQPTPALGQDEQP